MYFFVLLPSPAGLQRPRERNEHALRKTGAAVGSISMFLRGPVSLRFARNASEIRCSTSAVRKRQEVGLEILVTYIKRERKRSRSSSSMEEKVKRIERGGTSVEDKEGKISRKKKKGLGREAKREKVWVSWRRNRGERECPLLCCSCTYVVSMCENTTTGSWRPPPDLAAVGRFQLRLAAPFNTRLYVYRVSHECG